MADQYEEWFHRETQEVLSVKVGDAEGGVPNEIVFTLCSHCNQWYEVFREDLQRDYVRDEPVTLELLDRLGWEPSGRGMMVQIPAGPDAYLCVWVESSEVTETFVNVRTHVIDLSRARTLRDLLHAMRLFGIKSPISRQLK